MKWRDTNLSADGLELLYRGQIFVRPLGRGVVLDDLELKPQLDEVLDEGYYEAEIRIIRRLPPNIET
jgi:hypothetical protein